MKTLSFSVIIILYVSLSASVHAQHAGDTFDQLTSALQKAQAEISELKKENQQLKIAPTLEYQQQVDYLAYRHRRDMRKMDSISYELEGSKRVISVLNRMEKVEKERIARLEIQEAAMLELEARLQKQAQLISTQQANINQNGLSEEKHQALLQKLQDQEKRLKLLEQRLRMANSVGSSVGK